MRVLLALSVVAFVLIASLVRADSTDPVVQAHDYACWMVQSRAELVAQIALERSMPPSVSGRERLRSMLMALASLDQQLPAAKARYVALAHKPLVCP